MDIREAFLDEIFFHLGTLRFANASDELFERAFELDYLPTPKILDFFYDEIFPKI